MIPVPRDKCSHGIESAKPPFVIERPNSQDESSRMEKSVSSLLHCPLFEAVGIPGAQRRAFKSWKRFRQLSDFGFVVHGQVTHSCRYSTAAMVPEKSVRVWALRESQPPDEQDRVNHRAPRSMFFRGQMYALASLLMKKRKSRVYRCTRVKVKGCELCRHERRQMSLQSAWVRVSGKNDSTRIFRSMPWKPPAVYPKAIYRALNTAKR